MNRFVLITGCSSGIGHCAAHRLQAAGFQVIASCRSAQDVQRLRSEGLAHVLQLDLASSASIERAAEQALAIAQGAVYGLFNNGAYGQPGAVEDLSRQALREQFETNVFGTHELTCRLLPAMLALPDARIVQNSSVLGFVPMPARGAYIASKYALEGLTDTLRLELRGTSVKVSLLEPGPITTQFRHNALAAFKRHIDIDRSRHADMYRESMARLGRQESKTKFSLPAEAVVAKLLLALSHRNPRARYRITLPTHVLGVLKRTLSTRALDAFITRFGGS